jgi:hypothetical protein
VAGGKSDGAAVTTVLQRLTVVTKGGVQDLARVVNVMALLDLKVVTLSTLAAGEGLRVEAWVRPDEPAVTLCVARLNALWSVTTASASSSSVS